MPGTAKVDGLGGWSFTTAALPDGSHSFTAKATDAAGNTTTTAAVTATVDTSVPAETLAITSIAGGSSPNDTTVTVSGTNGALSAGEKIQVSSNGGTTWTDVVQNTRTAWSFVDGTTHSASFTYQARIINAAGSIGTTASQAVLVAGSGGTLSITGSSAF